VTGVEATLAPSGGVRPPRDPRPRDIISHTQTPGAPGADGTAIKNMFGDHAKNKLLVHSTKSMIGHALGAAGAVESVAFMLVLVKGIVWVTRRLLWTP
jgi:hypothetical protein